jgi:radical SAM superfamily enzyme YgiQ (UPF0313 family)
MSRRSRRRSTRRRDHQARREIHPNAVTVLGGIHGTFMYGQVLGECAEIDYIVRGEGEEIVVNLVKAIAEGRMPAERDTVKGSRSSRTASRLPPRRIRRSRTSTALTPTGRS